MRQHLLLVFNINYYFIYQMLCVEGDLFMRAREDWTSRGDRRPCQRVW